MDYFRQILQYKTSKNRTKLRNNALKYAWIISEIDYNALVPSKDSLNAPKKSSFRRYSGGIKEIKLSSGQINQVFAEDFDNFAEDNDSLVPTEITGYRNITTHSIEKGTGNEDSVFSDTKMNMKKKDKKPRPIIRSHKEKSSVKEVILVR